MGETFAPDPHTGTGNFSVPITLPPGRNGFQPQLTLGYSTGNGNGLFGLGWSLSVPGVSRKTSKGLPHYHGDLDTFILSGAEDLVPVSDPGPVRWYRPRTEGLFARIAHHQDGRSDYWEVQSKDGLISRYGTPRPANVATWQDPATVADPNNPARVFAWKLTQTTDPFGNQIVYHYERDTVQTDGPHAWDQVYLKSIQYADYVDQGNPQFLVSITFDRAARPDPFSDYRAGFEVRTTQRYIRIHVATQADANRPVRTYHLIYLDQLSEAGPPLPRNGVSLLRQIRVEGHDDSSSEWLPPLEFSYSAFQPEERRYEPFSAAGGAVPDRSLAQPDYELVDLFANGLPSVLQMNGVVRYWRNRGSGRFDPPRMMTTAPAGVQLADGGVQIADMDGDGRADLLVADGTRAGYYPLATDGSWDRSGYVRYRQAPSVNLKDPDAKLVDLDGDGVIDALRTATSFELYYNDPRKGWGRPELRSRNDPDLPDVRLGDPRVKLADLTGDGLQDLVLVHSGRIDYWPYCGYGQWGQRITMRGTPRFEDAAEYGAVGYDPRRLLLGDVDGDGCADLVYVGSGHVTVWLNQSGNGWSEPIMIRGTPPIFDVDAVRLVDLHGTGMPGILWTYDLGTQRESTYKFLDLAGGIKPYLLTEMDNHIGAVTRVEYAPSTRFYEEDERRPERRWKTSLPFPVQVVSRVEAIDLLSRGKLTTEYSYHHGYWDGGEREFRGFGRVEQRDTETFDDYHAPGLGGDTAFAPVPPRYFSPPTLTKTWFHQGPVGPEFGNWTELDLRVEFWPGDPPALERSADEANLIGGLARRAARDAVRAMRGQVLRTELYALDGTNRQDRPYTVTESEPEVYAVLPTPVGDSDLIARLDDLPSDWKTEETATRIFFPGTAAQRTTQWERGDEPLTQLGFAEDYDRFGQPRGQISIAVPRGRDYRLALPPGAPVPEPYLATHAVSTYSQPVAPSTFIVDRVARVTTYEVPNDGHADALALRRAISAGTFDVPANLIGQTLGYYDGDAFTGLPFGKVGSHGALMRSEQLVLTDKTLKDAYTDGSAPLLTSPPPYLAAGGSVPWTDDYPVPFRSSLPVPAAPDPTRPGLAITPAGYGFADGTKEAARGYFTATERRRYDVNENVSGDPRSRGLVTVHRDPLGHDTSVTYDAPYHLLPVGVAVGPVDQQLATTASYDYRVLQPNEVVDPNGNHTRFRFSPLGLLTETWVAGQPTKTEGDRQRPSVRMTYDFEAFARAGRPIDVRTIRQVHHDTETDVAPAERDATITTVEYSDGFGRLLQTRTQAEDVAWIAPPTLYSTGVGSDGSLLPDGAVDPHWTITAQPRGTVPAATYATRVDGRPPTDEWLPNDPSSRWISPHPDENVGEEIGSYTYQTRFDLTGVDPTGVMLCARLAVETMVTDARVNGQSLGLGSLGGNRAWTPLVVPGPFAPGVNTLELVVLSNPIQALGISGLRVEWSLASPRRLLAGASANPDAAVDRPLVPLDQLRAGGAVVGYALADPVATPRVVVSGWQVYDNKGRVVEKYEPFFSTGWDYAAQDAPLGEKATMFYDPRGRVIRTLNPDGSEQRVVYGIPLDLTKPDDYLPTPWETYAYDANDLAPLSNAPAPDLFANANDPQPGDPRACPLPFAVPATGTPVQRGSLTVISDPRSPIVCGSGATDSKEFHFWATSDAGGAYPRGYADVTVEQVHVRGSVKGLLVVGNAATVGIQVEQSSNATYVGDAFFFAVVDSSAAEMPALGPSLADRAPVSHHDTPSSAVVDALGRVVSQTVRNEANPLDGWHTTLDLPGSTLTGALRMNAQGDVCGSYKDSSGTIHGFLFRDGSYTTFDIAGAKSTGIEACGNSQGGLVGNFQDSDGKWHGFLLHNGSYMTLDVPGSDFTHVSGFSAQGDVYGYAPRAGQLHGFVLRDGTYTTLDVPGATGTLLFDTGSDGAVVGGYGDSEGHWHGFVLRDGSYTTLDVPGAAWTGAYGINAQGDIVGIYQDSSGKHHGYLLRGGTYTTLDVPGAAETYANSIDAHGTVVGSYLDGSGHQYGVVLSGGAYTTRSTYDLLGNLLTVTDARGRLAFRHAYDLAKRPLWVESIDAGVRQVVYDAAGNPLEQRDAKGALDLHAPDALNRPSRLWARDATGQTVTLREKLVYGDAPDAGLSADAVAAGNLRGKLYQHDDEAGRLTFAAYDFKGNPLGKARQVIADAALLAPFTPPSANWVILPFRVDWDSEPPFDPTVYETSLAYDALNRVTALRYPLDVDSGGDQSKRKTLRPRYNRAGALEHVELDGQVYVEQIAYNARGQRTLVAYGNGVMTRYAYDPRTFRLTRLRSEKFTQSQDQVFAPAGGVLQDFGYDYDLVGNVAAIHDRAPGSGTADPPGTPDALDRAFGYDPLYRLLSATGREFASTPPAPWDASPRGIDVTKTRSYTENYQYDPVGNLLQLQHVAIGGSFTRQLTLAPGDASSQGVPRNNQLDSMTTGTATFRYAYDPSGNLTDEDTSRHFAWDHADRMKVFRVQTGGSEPSVHAQYLYDAKGQRVKKLVRAQGGAYEVTVYVDGAFEHHRQVSATGSTRENDVLQVMDNQSRVALARVGDPFPDDKGPAVQYHLGDYLGSSNLVVDDKGTWTNREEYTPYGETSFGSFARKRYRFTGKERDEESGLYYHGARYYAPWVARWISCDPAGMTDSLNLYSYARANPTLFVDPNGEQTAGDNTIYMPEIHITGTVSTDPPSPPTAVAPDASLGEFQLHLQMAPTPAGTGDTTQQPNNSARSFDSLSPQERLELTTKAQIATAHVRAGGKLNGVEVGSTWRQPALFYSSHDRAVDELVEQMDIVPGARLARLAMDLYYGEKVSGHPVDRAEVAKDLVKEGVFTLATVLSPGSKVSTALNREAADFYVYQLVDEAGDAVYYGKTNDPLTRLADHARKSKFPFTGMQVISRPVPEAQALNLETSLIEQAKAEGRTIYNQVKNTLNWRGPRPSDLELPTTIMPKETLLNPKLYSR